MEPKKPAPERPVTQVSTRQIYRNNWMTVREDVVRFSNDERGIFGVVEKPDFSIIVPQHKSGHLQMVRQYRYPVENSFWELPQGSMEGDRNAAPAFVALAELAEETGFLATKVDFVASLYQGYGYATQKFHIFVATDLILGEVKRELSESDMMTSSFSIADIIAMIEHGEIQDGVTVATIGLMRLRGLL